MGSALARTLSRDIEELNAQQKAVEERAGRHNARILAIVEDAGLKAQEWDTPALRADPKTGEWRLVLQPRIAPAAAPQPGPPPQPNPASPAGQEAR